jgi:membrane fusion protein
MGEDIFFRSEVLPSEDKLRLGEVLLIPPLPSGLLTKFALLVVVGIAAMLGLASYTRHVTLQGVIVPADGVVKLYAQQNGELRSLKVRGGDRVHQGQVLMAFSSERRGTLGLVVEQEIGHKLHAKLDKLREERESTLRLQSSEKQGLQQALDSQIAMRQRLTQEVALLDKRDASAETTAARFEGLRQAGYVTEQMAQEKRDEQLEQQLRLQSARRDMTASEQEIERLRLELVNAPHKQQVALDQIDREISNAELDIAQQEVGHDWVLTSPCECVVSSLDIGVGQIAAPNFPLISLLPFKGGLQAKLYAPSRALGFVTVGQRVDLKLDAFPFEKFGAVAGRVDAIAETPLTSGETSPGTHLALPQADGPQEPLYAVTVRLDEATIEADGQARTLRAGMQLNADVQLETRHLYQWLLRPLYESAHH